jgi:hypothetical protein
MTPITPPPGLLDKVAEALISEGGGPGNSLHSWRCEHPDIYGPCGCVAETPRILWDAVAEGLRLREDHYTTGGSPTGPVLPPSRTFRRLVSRWEPQP